MAKAHDKDEHGVGRFCYSKDGCFPCCEEGKWVSLKGHTVPIGTGWVGGSRQGSQLCLAEIGPFIAWEPWGAGPCSSFLSLASLSGMACPFFPFWNREG